MLLLWLTCLVMLNQLKLNKYLMMIGKYLDNLKCIRIHEYSLLIHKKCAIKSLRFRFAWNLLTFIVIVNVIGFAYYLPNGYIYFLQWIFVCVTWEIFWWSKGNQSIEPVSIHNIPKVSFSPNIDICAWTHNAQNFANKIYPNFLRKRGIKCSHGSFRCQTMEFI